MKVREFYGRRHAGSHMQERRSAGEEWHVVICTSVNVSVCDHSGTFYSVVVHFRCLSRFKSPFNRCMLVQAASPA